MLEAAGSFFDGSSAAKHKVILRLDEALEHAPALASARRRVDLVGLTHPPQPLALGRQQQHLGFRVREILCQRRRRPRCVP